MATSLNALVLKINADTSGVSAGVRAVRADVNKINRIMRQTASASDRAKDAQSALNRIYKTGALTSQEYARGLGAINKKYTDIETKNRGVAASFGAVKNQVLGLLSVYGALSAVRGGLTDQFAIDRAGIQMGVFTKNMERGRDIAQQMDQFAGRTPLSFDSVIRSGTLLAGVRVETENLMDRLQRLGDVSMGNSERFNRLALAYSQVLGKQRLMGQEANQLREAGMLPLQLISGRTGETIRELTKRMEQGGISAKEVTQALEDATSAGGDFHNMLNTMSGGNEGSVNRMSESVRRLKRDLVGLYADDIGDAASGVSGAIEKIRKAIGDKGAEFGKKLQTSVTGSHHAMNMLVGTILRVGKSAEDTERLINPLNEALAESKRRADALHQQRIAAAEKTAQLVDPVLKRYQDQNRELMRQNAIRKLGIHHVELMEAKKAGASRQDLAQLRRLQEMNAELEKRNKISEQAKSAKTTDEVSGLQAKAQQLMEQLKSPFERLVDDLAELEQMRRQNLIDEQIGQRAVREATQRFRESRKQLKTTPIKVELPPLATKGSREEFRLIASMKRQSEERSQDRQEQARQHQEAQQTRQEVVEAMREAVAKLDNLEPAQSV